MIESETHTLSQDGTHGEFGFEIFNVEDDSAE